MKKKLLFVISFLSIITVKAQQRELTAPELSQAASVTQRIGLTDISISYHSPLAKGRKIWGELVPYNEVWRAGANENTVISFSTDVTVEGKFLAAGTYGLHMIPTPREWKVIFSKNAAAWGSFFYNEKEDALRVNVVPRKAENQEWLSYSFINPKAISVTAALHWEELVIPFDIGIDVPETVYQNMKKELTGINGFFWQGFNQAAAYCIQNKIHLDDAAKWIDNSISIQKNFTNLNTKAKLLEVQQNNAEASAIKKEALSIADEVQLNAYGYELLGQGRMNDAIELFRDNVKRYPTSWNVYDSLGEALEKSGDKKGAMANYKTALAKAPEAQKKRLETVISKLK